MRGVPLRCVVDTNVAATANGSNEGAPADCVAASALALQSVKEAGHVFLDDGGKILAEYRANLQSKGQPGPGDAFLRWLYQVEWNADHVTRVPITSKAGHDEDFEELPTPPEGLRFDPSDRKFLAVAAAHGEHPPILQSFDSKWWGWTDALQAAGVTVHFLCPKAIEAKFHQKMQA